MEHTHRAASPSRGRIKEGRDGAGASGPHQLEWGKPESGYHQS